MENICYLDDLLVVVVATNKTDSYYRFIRSLNVYGYKYEVFIAQYYIQRDERGSMRHL